MNRILWADDEIHLLKPYIIYLQEKGYEVIPVNNGQDAIDACQEQPFDIVFLDPPYAAGLLTNAIKAVLPLMSDYGMIICEYPPEVAIPEEIGGFKVYRTYRYGKINAAIYRKGL